MNEMGFVLASKRLVQQKLKVTFMYREKVDNPQDSGWRFFSEYDTDEYVNNPENIGIYDINSIIEVDESIVPYLNSNFGTAFEKKGTTFVELRDFFDKK